METRKVLRVALAAAGDLLDKPATVAGRYVDAIGLVGCRMDTFENLLYHLQLATDRANQLCQPTERHRLKLDELMQATRRFMMAVSKLTGEHEVKQIRDALAVLALLLQRDLGVGDHALQPILLVSQALEESGLVGVQQAASHNVLQR